MITLQKAEVVSSNPPRELLLLPFWSYSRMEIPLKPDVRIIAYGKDR
jgi:hypothetical protein